MKFYSISGNSKAWQILFYLVYSASFIESSVDDVMISLRPWHENITTAFFLSKQKCGWNTLFLEQKAYFEKFQGAFDKQEVSSFKRASRCDGRRRCLGKRRFDGRSVHQRRLHEPPRVFLPAPDAFRRWADDHFLPLHRLRVSVERMNVSLCLYSCCKFKDSDCPQIRDSRVAILTGFLLFSHAPRRATKLPKCL